MSHPLKCRCGALRGLVDTSKVANRCICYCKDCQAFAHFLRRPADTLDAQGGTDIVQTLPARVEIATGRDQLACMRLTDKGIVRWYARCCRTPIGNTLHDRRFSFVGLIHDCLEGADRPLDASFGPVRAWVHTQSARDPAAVRTRGLVGATLRIATMMLRARLDGSYRRTPFFAGDGALVATPTVLSAEERRALAAAVDLPKQLLPP